MIFLKKVWLYIKKIPFILAWYVHDMYNYVRSKGWKVFDKWGLHIYVAKFGGGKTSSMVYRAYKLCKRFPQVSVVTNITLTGFPEHTQILPLNTVNDILNAPENCIVLIDEIGTIFNSRDFMQKDALPKILFQHLCQCRKRKMIIMGTVQRWQFLDKQLRDITDKVYVCRSHFAHPFTRVTTTIVYDAFEYDQSYNNPMIKLAPLDCNVVIQTNKVRQLYDTTALVDNMLKADYVDDATILQNQGYAVGSNAVVTDKKGSRSYKRSVKGL